MIPLTIINVTEPFQTNSLSFINYPEIKKRTIAK
jgi:hypothetical protein